MLNPLVLSLPQLLVVPLASVPELAPTVELLFSEAFDLKDGRQAAVDRLAEYFVILLLRSAIASRILEAGILLALSDTHLSRAFHSIHEQPERAWTLEELAHIAGMSRARFAVRFRVVTGQTPFGYLALWRIGVAQSLLKKGEPLKLVAPSVGFASAEALTRSFSQLAGMPPMAWLAAQQGQAPMQ
jgi:transcriptional regulator GlxA family with amidase domain